MGAVYREELSANARKLIEQLLSLPQGWVTAAALAESIGVSRRTVLRELPAVEQWMQAAGAHFVRNPGKGLLLDEASERRDALRTQLNSGDRKKLSRAERRQQLLTRLLSEQEPCKTAVLARALGVSESTLSADLDELETKLHPYRVEMFRRPGVGVWLQGDASSYRRVVSALLRSSMPEKELAEVLCGRMPENEIFSTLLDTKTAEKVWAVLQQFEQEEQLHLPDAGFLALAIHCTLTIQQLRQGGDKGSAPRGLRPAGNHAARLVAALNRAFGLTLPPEEAQYLELYLSAYLGAEDPWGSAQEMELRNLEAALIREMEKALHTDLSGYTSLRDDLYCHLRPMLLRVEQNIRTENPQLDTIRTAYPGLWKATRAACDAVQQQFVLPAISDAEAAYLAMHFGAVLEQNAMFRLRLRVVVACPLGMGSSRFLASRLGNEFPSLQVEGCCSVRELNTADLRLDTFELPEIKDDEILVKVVSDSICMSTYKCAILGTAHKRVHPDVAEHPAIMGHEFAGDIVKVGKAHQDKFKPGMKFTLQPALNYKGTMWSPGYSYEFFGGDATYCIIPAEVMELGCLLEYKGRAYYEASLAEPMSCSIGAFNAAYHTKMGVYHHDMGIKKGGKLAILAGAGPMGLGALTYALHRDVRPGMVVVTDINEDRLARAESLFPPKEVKEKDGIDLYFVNTANMADPAAELRELTGGTGFDDVFCYAPIAPVVELSSAVLGRDGCLNFFAGPTDKQFSAKMNFYDVHYNSTHVMGTTGGNTADMIESLELTAAKRIDPAVMVTHIGGLNAAAETTLNLPKIPGGKKLIYTHLTMPLIALTDLRAKGEQDNDPRYTALADIVDAHNGLWCPEAEEYLLANFNPED